MDELTVKALDSMIENIIKENSSQIKMEILSGGNDLISADEIYSLMTFNCLSLSLKLSVQVVFEILRSQGVLQIDEREIAKLFLKHLSSEKKD